MRFGFRFLQLTSFVLLFACNIVFAIAIAKTQDMDFGTSAQGDSAKTITPATSCTANGQACFSVTGGAASTAFSVALTAPTNMSGPGADMAVSTFTTNPASLTTNASGNRTFRLGAQHGAIGGGQTPGSYSGTFTITVTQGASNANTTFTSSKTILTTIGVSRISHMQFGDAAQNDVAQTINPSASPSGAGTVTRAEFAVTGEPNRAFTVTGLPSTTQRMTTGAGATLNTRINVTTFAYFVVGTAGNNTNGSLDGSGNRTVYVGATRAAIRAAQVAGAYALDGTSGTGVFTATVTYQ